MTIKLSRDLMQDILYSDAVIEDRIVGAGRWSIRHSLIFRHNDKVYMTTYQRGATESQDERPWEYDTEVECTEVHQVERTVKVWEPLHNVQA